MLVTTSARPRAVILVATAWAVLLGSLLVGIAGEPAVARAPRPAARAAAVYQDAIFSTSNAQRRLHDRSTFRHHRCVQRYAVRQAARMARQERMFHQDLAPVLRDCGLSKVGENVAYGYATGVDAVVDGWMRSASHRHNLLDRDFRLLGSGARLGDDGVWYAAQVFGRR